ncbi:pre-mRNA-processing factor [Achlya hypogyna]|uniref:Pre-mRNA-processing factor 17 n=1 Tax=Achlya hypogyna TaxID=1202772 RepID=A0A1V9YLR7_ACHHY|nr:pre-mRNA-processing factor [Achlya hypogyna]
MDLLAAYASSDEDETPRVTVNSAPEVLLPLATSTALAPSAKTLALNQPVGHSLAPVLGPKNPYVRHNPLQVGAGKEIVTGVVETTEMEDFCFDEAYHAQQFRSTDPLYKKAPKRKVVPNMDKDVGTEAEHGIWAPQKNDNTFWVASDAEKDTLSDAQKKLLAENETKRLKRNTEDDDEVNFDRMVERKVAHLLPPRLQPGQKAVEPKSAYLDREEYDYQGRSWIEHPRELKADDGDHPVYLPKKAIHQWEGHTKGVQAIELFPKYGHLLLSGSLDSTVRIWDVYNERKCKRIYQGHTNAVRGINFAPDGKTFLTCSFDRFIRLWDTETGQVLHTFTNRRVPYCIKFHPVESDQFVIGDSNHMIVQFDTRSGGTVADNRGQRGLYIVQEYNHHLQTVNAVTFVDDNRRYYLVTNFVSTSDDKKILIWEWGIPVPIKYVSEQGMHSMPATTLHPSGNYFAGQCLSNQIDVYTARDKFKLQRRKVFRGHACAGYACQVGFSPNGQYVVSGDGEGQLVFWDWKTTRMFKKVQAHAGGPTMGVQWHPIEASKVVTCGWDGLIKYWD